MNFRGLTRKNLLFPCVSVSFRVFLWFIFAAKLRLSLRTTKQTPHFFCSAMLFTPYSVTNSGMAWKTPFDTKKHIATFRYLPPNVFLCITIKHIY